MKPSGHDHKHSIAIPMQIKILDNLGSIDRMAWNHLLSDNNPFLKYEFLSALECNHCVNEECGWQPQHIVIYDDNGKLVAASPLYLKYHSYGEFVFDWAWADAYQRNQLAYYPKLVSAIPFTPITGPRLLTAPGVNAEEMGRLLIETTINLAREHNYSSAHWLFPTTSQKNFMQHQGLITRLSCQYHWQNRNYENFDHFLSHFSSRKRKNILKERRQVGAAGVNFRLLNGNEINSEEWQIFYKFYCEIYKRKWGSPSLSLAFFEEISSTLPEQVLLVLAYKDNKCIGAALNLRSDNILYGRHWGCSEQLPGLHFETCYYQGLEYCIKNGLERFEPGAQGEHKIARGFLPTKTWSAHWIAEPQFRQAIEQFTRNEAIEIEKMMLQLENHSPFRQQ